MSAALAAILAAREAGKVADDGKHFGGPPLRSVLITFTILLAFAGVAIGAAHIL